MTVDPRAAAVHPDPQAPRPGGTRVHTRWRVLARPSPYGHFRQLRDRLNPFIQQLAERVDNGHRLPQLIGLAEIELIATFMVILIRRSVRM
ncbi:hypothetical protein [Micromonospora sp. NPDC023737]|uniref:hypothetical protein n=1 Tax=unclassified Micromonospora TaxID=2617518 RepID=UPI0033D27F99